MKPMTALRHLSGDVKLQSDLNKAREDLARCVERIVGDLLDKHQLDHPADFYRIATSTLGSVTLDTITSSGLTHAGRVGIAEALNETMLEALDVVNAAETGETHGVLQ
jgi:hypothetical protein